jgi:hypothetical protein
MSLERRRHARIPLRAQVCVTHVDNTVELEALDVSEGGVFLEAEPEEMPEFSEGAEVNLRIFDPDTEDDDHDVLAMAKVIRVVRPARGPTCSGLALEFTELGEEDSDRLRALLTRFQAGRGAA